MPTKLLSVEDAAAMLGRSTHAIYSLVKRRKIPFRKDGRRVLFVEHELQAFINHLSGLSLDDLREHEETEA